MGDINVLNYLNDQKRTNAECAAEWIEIESLFKDKLWKQLPEKIFALISHPAFRNEDSMIFQFYRNFISTFETKLDPYKLVDIVGALTNFISDKTKAIEILESIEYAVKGCNEAVWHCYVLKGQIQLNHLNDLVATKQIIDTLSSALGNAADVPVHWYSFSLATNYFHRVLDECNDNYRRFEEKFHDEKEKYNDEIKRLHNEMEKSNGEISRLHNEVEKFRGEKKRLHNEVEKFRGENKRLNNEVEKFKGEVGRLNNKIEEHREIFEEKLLSVQTEIEAKFTTEAVRNFEEVINSQTELSNLRKLNGRLLSECSQLRNQRNGLEDDKTKLEEKVETVITEQEKQKTALMLMGALLDKLSVKNDDDEGTG